MVLGNWKLNGGLLQNKMLLEEIKKLSTSTRVGVAVPFPYLAQVSDLLDNSCVFLGAQDVSAHEKGAYTGEVSAAMLAEFGVKFALVGHSERRMYHAESNDLIVKKVKQLLSYGIIPVLCVGESLEEREAGLTAHIVLAQLMPVLNALSSEAFQHVVVAYEPVWAIGTGKTATAAQAQEVHLVLRNALVECFGMDVAKQTNILYGGSVKSDNASILFGEKDIDGGLIGGASLVAQDFVEIVRAAEGIA
jgi:triosephosphate isomerase (TIM)